MIAPTLALVVAAQLPLVPETAHPTSSETSRSLRYGESPPALAARSASYFDDAAFTLKPDADLRLFDTAFVTDVERPADVEVTARPMFLMLNGARTCVASVEINLRSDTAEIVVDWSRTTFVVEGVAQNAIPGFARKVTSNLSQRPSSAPAGVTLTESVFAMGAQDGQCVAGGDLILDVPFTVGGAPSRTRVSVRLEPVAATEAQAFANVPAPSVRPEVPADFFPMWTTVGASAGVLAGAGLATASALGGAPIGSSLLGGGVIALLCGGTCGGAGAFFGDASAFTKAKEAEIENTTRTVEVQRHAAWSKRRSELGLVAVRY